jgi:hypothetical protein
MSLQSGKVFRILSFLVLSLAALGAQAQSGNAGTVRGTLTDPSGAVVPNVAVHLVNERQRIRPDRDYGRHRPFRFSNVPFNPYRISVSAPRFAHR